ncbi:MAG: hypothetical protein KKF89_04745, partial [Nanoarchaeota archaeon]|nr:hypothetical protein [Nanoarchaeota archaeon]
MYKKILVLFLVMALLITGCKTDSGDENLITGEVIEIPPAEDIVVEIEDNDEPIKTEDDFSDILVRV